MWGWNGLSSQRLSPPCQEPCHGQPTSYMIDRSEMTREIQRAGLFSVNRTRPKGLSTMILPSRMGNGGALRDRDLGKSQWF